MEGATSGAVTRWLRLEGACVLLGCMIAYAMFGAGWKVLAIFFLAPDLTFLAYLRGPRFGAICYNVAHSHALPITGIAIGMLTTTPAVVTAGLIWSAHIGLDRALGYGLKYPSAFRHTHLGLIGRDHPSED